MAASDTESVFYKFLRSLPDAPSIEEMTVYRHGPTGTYEVMRIPYEWELPYMVIAEMQKRKVWATLEDVILTAVDLCKVGARFLDKWGKATRDVKAHVEPGGWRAVIILDGDVATGWNEEIAVLKREMDTLFRTFEHAVKSWDLEYRVKDCFDTQRDMGVNTDGEEWWSATIEALLQDAREWIDAPFTLEMCFEEMARKMQTQDELREIRVCAPVLGSTNEGPGYKFFKEGQIYRIRDGNCAREYNLIWTSVDLPY